MSRPKNHDAQGRRVGAEDEGEPRPLLDPLKSFRPLGKGGPASHLKEEMIIPLARLLAGGATYTDAAAAQGTTEACLRGWMGRGREAAAKGEENLYTKLLVEVAGAVSHYRRFLLEQGHASIGDKQYSDKFIRWRLAVSAPLDFTVPTATAGTGSGNPAFEVVNPEQALEALAGKIKRFLEIDGAHVAAEAQKAAPHAQ